MPCVCVRIPTNSFSTTTCSGEEKREEPRGRGFLESTPLFLKGRQKPSSKTPPILRKDLLNHFTAVERDQFLPVVM